jgi:hypothetical protein
MSENLQPQISEAAALDLERRRIALKTAAGLHDPSDISALMATASNLYGWLSLSARTIMRQAETLEGRRAASTALAVQPALRRTRVDRASTDAGVPRL